MNDINILTLFDAILNLSRYRHPPQPVLPPSLCAARAQTRASKERLHFLFSSPNRSNNMNPSLWSLFRTRCHYLIQHRGPTLICPRISLVASLAFGVRKLAALLKSNHQDPSATTQSSAHQQSARVVHEPRPSTEYERLDLIVFCLSTTTRTPAQRR